VSELDNVSVENRLAAYFLFKELLRLFGLVLHPLVVNVQFVLVLEAFEILAVLKQLVVPV
jgi:hypothetical protein